MISTDGFKTAGIQIAVSVFLSLGMYVAAFWILTQTPIYSASIGSFLNTYGPIFLSALILVESFEAMIQRAQS